MMQTLRVGQPYPHPLEIRDGLATQPGPSGLTSIIHLSRFEKGDLRAFRDSMTVAVTQVEPNLPWLSILFRKNRLTLDGPILVGHRPELRDHLERAGNLLQFVFLEGNRYKVRHLRAVGLSDEIMAAIKTALGQTSHIGHLQEMVLRAQRTYPTSDDVYQAASVKQHFQR